ncbi:DUF2637 domain-containing protein [Streptomyces sp. NPDC049879]|uniref:DUF2637 domain-containing protein n=1 Tax=Streptomyces sp. NPDC049879 TaxID=3365598 RepID=UPI00378FCF6D
MDLPDFLNPPGFLGPASSWVSANLYLVLAMVISMALTCTVALILVRRRTGAEPDPGTSPLDGIGPQAVVALGGVAVSVYGLWQFATEVAGLPPVMALGFIAVFDAAELTLLVMMYRQADAETGWTPELRLMHRTAWTLVAFSAAMNAIHAPTLWSMPVLGAIPGLAAWLIELKLRAKLHAPGIDDDEYTKPGPLRLVILLWQHSWSALFALLGLDAADRGSDIARAALARTAAAAVYQLRLALQVFDRLKQTHASERRTTRAEARVERRRRAAQRAVDRADIATDPKQALAMARRMATLTGVDGIAQATYSDAAKVMDMLETLAIVPSAQRISANARAMEAEAARQRAEDARQEAEAARQRAAEETDAAGKELERLHNARQEAETAANREADRAETARQEADRAESARQEAEAARQRAEDEADAAARRARQLGDDAGLSRERLEHATAELHALQQQLDAARQGRHGTEDQLAALRRELDDLTSARGRAEAAYNGAAQKAREAQDAAETRRGELTLLNQALQERRDQVRDADDSRRTAEDEARRAAEHAAAQHAQVREITALLDRLRGELAEHITPGPTPGHNARLFESDAKQRGWEHYRALASTGRAEPSAAELAERFQVAPGNARNWLLDFRAARARELTRPAAHPEPGNATPVPA